MYLQSDDPVRGSDCWSNVRLTRREMGSDVWPNCRADVPQQNMIGVNGEGVVYVYIVVDDQYLVVGDAE